ncbi:hypothetical protein LTR66_003182 [Elasticomyces elasticus]|nr:hypothetical protein LTR50_005629 [Elasticomyces elasticus]KAK4997384.1 hypothetical protein LTR66_003182 [Elasticomyces elasticus]
MADEDNFDIDIYGDEGQDYLEQDNASTTQAREVQDISNLDGAQDNVNLDEPQDSVNVDEQQDPSHHESVNATEAGEAAGPDTDNASTNLEMLRYEPENDDSAITTNQQIVSTVSSTIDQLQIPKQAPVQQGVKRKEGEDDRAVDPGATPALRLQDLQWWTTEDDLRGWANQCGCEDEVKEITFHEHKVNGKSKGEAFIELSSPQAATALKHQIESFGVGQQYAKKHAAIYTRPEFNPYKTHPKDAPPRAKDSTWKDTRNNAVGYNANNSMAMASAGNTNANGNFRGGGRGGFNNRGGVNSNNNNMAFNQNQMRNFPGQQMGMQQGYGGGAFPTGPMGFNRGGGMMGGMMNGVNPMMGGMGGMRGGMPNRGRGGMMGNMMMTPNGMMGAGMGGMGMGGGMGGMAGMGMGMGMGAGMGMGMGMGMGAMPGFPGSPQTHFNPQFYAPTANSPGNAAAATAAGVNPHPAKRPRPE